MAAVNVRLRQLIDALGIKYVRAAEDMGITKNHLGNWMREEKPVYPDIYKIYRFCRIRGVDFNWVFLGPFGAAGTRVPDFTGTRTKTGGSRGTGDPGGRNAVAREVTIIGSS